MDAEVTLTNQTPENKSFLRRCIAFWETLITVGVTPELTYWEKKRIRLLNGICLMSVMILGIYCLMYLDYEHRLTFWESFIGLILSAVPIYLNHLKKFDLACHFFCIFNLLAYSFQAVSHGAVDGVEYILVASSIASMLFFNDLRVVITYFLLNGLFFAGCKYSFMVMKPFLFMPDGENLYTSNHVILFAIVFLIVLYFKQENARQEKLLESKNKNLSIEKQKVEDALIQLKATQNQLIQSEKLASLGELTAGIAHEIQNPLNFVNNFSDLSVELVQELQEVLKQKGISTDSEESELLADLIHNQQKIHHHGTRASSIVKGMLEHSRMGTGEKQPTDLNKLIHEYVHLAFHGFRAKNDSFNVALKTTFDPNLSILDIIPQDIGRVLVNLLNNAFYAVHQQQLNGTDPAYSPFVSISTQQIDNQAIIHIEDNGIGMPESVIAKIFQPFFTTKPTGQGTGLGLSLAYDIVTKGHGGSIEVHSKEGEGSHFVITLPV
ncbi:MAG: ATP-binding protein [Spirosomataceae bacterium]